MVSTTAWQSSPAVNPGPMPMTMGAMSMAVPTLRLAKMASISTSGSSQMHEHFGSTSTGMTPSSARRSASSALSARMPTTPSTWVFPERTASLKATVRRTVKGCSTSVIMTETPHLCRRNAIALAMSPAPRIIASIEILSSKGFLQLRGSCRAPRCARQSASRRRFQPC